MDFDIIYSKKNECFDIASFLWGHCLALWHRDMVYFGKAGIYYIIRYMTAHEAWHYEAYIFR